MIEWFRFRITFQTIRDTWKITLIITLLFMGMAVMYTGVYPAFKETMTDLAETMSEEFGFVPGAEYLDTYTGYLNLELYQIFWILILGILIGFIAASLISKEVESKTIDLLLSNPVSRKQIILEKYLGLIPFILLVNVAVMLTVYGVTLAIGEEINLGDLGMAHAVSLPYFLAIAGIGVLISVIIDEKMKASIVTVAIIIGMFIFRSISLMIPDYESIGYISLSHYYNPADILIKGEVDAIGIIVLVAVMLECLLVAMLYFEKRDITVS